MNAYYLITLPNASATGLLTAFMAFCVEEGNPHELLHYRKSLNGTKYIVQGTILPALEQYLVGKSYITYLGAYCNGFAEASVHEYIQNNQEEWIDDEN